MRSVLKLQWYAGLTHYKFGAGKKTGGEEEVTEEEDGRFDRLTLRRSSKQIPT